jgi:prepilin-type N-terminal cleavage/methylation domain-containing protein
MTPARPVDAGFTLAEILAAAAVVAVGLVGTAAAFQHALAGIEGGRAETIAAFLAEEKLEHLKAAAVADWAHASLVPGTTTEFCQPGGPCRLAPSPLSYRRTTAITRADGCALDCRVVQVSVFYRTSSGDGHLAHERRVDVMTLFTPRS